jgi:hypothetical protein
VRFLKREWASEKISFGVTLTLASQIDHVARSVALHRIAMSNTPLPHTHDRLNLNHHPKGVSLRHDYQQDNLFRANNPNTPSPRQPYWHPFLI